jgi:hypothetical protein
VGDVMRDRVLAELFATAEDPILVSKWKDVSQDAETVTSLEYCSTDTARTPLDHANAEKGQGSLQAIHTSTFVASSANIKPKQ